MANLGAVHRGQPEVLLEGTWLKTEAISTLSHQMRTPLAAIKGDATALRLQGREYDEATRQEFMQIIDEEVDKLRR